MAAYGTGGSFGLVLHDPKDQAAADLATRIFQRLQREGSWGIDQIYDRAWLQAAKAYPNSFAAVTMRVPFMADGERAGPWLTAAAEKGTHGYAPGMRQMDAAFVAVGPGIAPDHLPRGHIVDVAPTVAALLGLPMTGTEGKNLLLSHAAAR